MAPDALQDVHRVPCPEAAGRDRRRSDACPSAIAAWDAWDGARPDAAADGPPAPPDADAGRSAVPEPDVPALAVVHWLLAAVAPYIRDVARSAERSCAASARHAALPLAEAQPRVPPVAEVEQLPPPEAAVRVRPELPAAILRPWRRFLARAPRQAAAWARALCTPAAASARAEPPNAAEARPGAEARPRAEEPRAVWLPVPEEPRQVHARSPPDVPALPASAAAQPRGAVARAHAAGPRAPAAAGLAPSARHPVSRCATGRPSS